MVEIIMKSVKVGGVVATLEGREINVGSYAPVVSVVNSDGLHDFTVGGAKDKRQLILALPSLDTGVCAHETQNFSSKIARLGNDKVIAVVVSMDLPFASGRFCSVNKVENIIATSDYRYHDFGKNYGVLMSSGPLSGLLARAVFVIDTTGKVIYKELVDDITKEPDYNAAIAMLG
jgi:thioredoxin-dependent peroxiredoxin